MDSVQYTEKGIHLLDGGWSQQRIRSRRRHIKVWLDGNLILEATDNDFVKTGSIRIGAGNNVMCLDNILVTSLEK